MILNIMIKRKKIWQRFGYCQLRFEEPCKAHCRTDVPIKVSSPRVLPGTQLDSYAPPDPLSPIFSPSGLALSREFICLPFPTNLLLQRRQLLPRRWRGGDGGAGTARGDAGTRGMRPRRNPTTAPSHTAVLDVS